MIDYMENSKMGTNNIKELLETIDAAMFSGDSCNNKETTAMIKEYIDRWDREIIAINNMLDIEVDEDKGVCDNCWGIGCQQCK